MTCGRARLRSVIARQEISAPRFQLRNELLRELEFDLGVGLSEHAEKAAQAEGRTVLHDFRLRRTPQLLRFGEGVFQLAKSINQFVVESVLARENPAVGDGVAKQIGGKNTPLVADSEKYVTRFHKDIFNS